jgi:hypothetical protein
MKQLSAIWMLVLSIALVPVTAFGQAEYTIDGVNPLALALDSGTCQTVTIILDPSDVITTPLIQAGFWLVYDPDHLTIGDVIPWDWEHGGPWDPGFYVLIPPDPLLGIFYIVVGNFDAVPVGLPIPICDIELCCEGPGQSQITISTIPAFDTVLGDDTTVWDSQIADGIIDLWQIAPACSCEITGPYFVQIDAFLVVTEQYTALPAPYCVNPPDYLWRDDCYLADVDQTGLLHVPPTTDGEDCTIWVVDRANTDINTGEEVTCEIPIEIGGDW